MKPRDEARHLLELIRDIYGKRAAVKMIRETGEAEYLADVKEHRLGILIQTAKERLGFSYPDSEFVRLQRAAERPIIVCPHQEEFEWRI
jgi:hypothetical protein